MLDNPFILFAAGLVPLLVGSIWYGPLFGKSWMRMNGFTEESLKTGNVLVIFGVSYILSVVLAFGLTAVTNHQVAIIQLFNMHPDFADVTTEIGGMVDLVTNKYGDKHRSFGHGALHGAIAAVFMFFPLIAINAIFERRSWKYIGIHVGYWIVATALMGGVVCAWV